MTPATILPALAILSLGACSGPSVIDEAKAASLSECPGKDLETIVNGYFITGFDSSTQWTAYRTDNPDVVRITAAGKILYVGSPTDATLSFDFTSGSQFLQLTGVSFNGVEQPIGMAKALASNMCDEASA